MKLILFLWFLSTSLLLYSGGKGEAPAVLMYAAASTGDLMEEAVQRFKEASGIDVRISTASSGTLANQIAQGAPADLYLSASPDWMDYVVSLGLAEEVRPLLSNRLVLIAPAQRAAAGFALSGESPLPDQFEGRLSLGDPGHVPAGAYAKEFLTYCGWYESLEERLLPAADVRAALALVELSEAALGIVYHSDAARSEGVRVLSIIPREAHSPIEYSCALVKGASPQAEQFYRFLLDETRTGDLYRSHGFSLPGSGE